MAVGVPLVRCHLVTGLYNSAFFCSRLLLLARGHSELSQFCTQIKCKCLYLYNTYSSTVRASGRGYPSEIPLEIPEIPRLPVPSTSNKHQKNTLKHNINTHKLNLLIKNEQTDTQRHKQITHNKQRSNKSTIQCKRKRQANQEYIKRIILLSQQAKHFFL